MVKLRLMNRPCMLFAIIGQRFPIKGGNKPINDFPLPDYFFLKREIWFDDFSAPTATRVVIKKKDSSANDKNPAKYHQLSANAHLS